MVVEWGPDESGNILVISGGLIEHFGKRPRTDLSSSVMECRDGVIGPGRVNAHTHIYSGLVPLGMPPPKDAPTHFIEILERIWWKLDRALDKQTLIAAARYYVADALLAGTTTLIDHHESPNFIEGSLDVLADVCQELGIRAILCYGATERNGGRDEARRGLAECRRFIVENDRVLVRGLVGLHASFTVSDDTIREAGELCRELGTGLHIHLAEDAADVRDAEDRGYAGPLERLIELDALPPGSILAHGVHLSREQVRLAKQQGCWLVQNPRSNKGNGVGYPTALGESELVALGTDGYPARMADEAVALREAAKEHGEDESVVTQRIEGAWDLAKAQFDLTLAPLASGGAADAAAWSGERPRHLVVGGRRILENGSLLAADWREIQFEAQDRARDLWTRMESL
jgi:cytosine/adenosine deaminase-related metal-dependent hydrolase